MSDKQRGIHELYANDPEAADELVWGRKTDPVTRRGFLTRGGLVAMSAAVELIPPAALVAVAASGTTGRTVPSIRACGVATFPSSRVEARVTRVSSIPRGSMILAWTKSSQVSPLTSSMTRAATWYRMLSYA